MGIEHELQSEIRLTKLRQAILGTVQFAGIISLAVMMPKVVTLVDKMQKRGDDKLRSAVARLVDKGLLAYEKSGVRLTRKGELFLERNALPLKRPAKWDGKWRMVIFDIPENKKRHRDLLRTTITRLGFFRLQNSVWIYPYDCEELGTLLKTEYSLGKNVLYMIVDKIENSSFIKRHFRL